MNPYNSRTVRTASPYDGRHCNHEGCDEPVIGYTGSPVPILHWCRKHLATRGKR